MPDTTKKKTKCAICDRELTLSTQIIVNGCPYCGSYKFKTYRESLEDDEKKQELELIVEKEIGDTDIQEGVEAIRLTSNGVFEVDIDKLLSESKDNQPIVGRNKDGSYYIKLQSKKENEENE